MASERRQQQVDEVLKELVADILNKEIDIAPDTFLTVTRVAVAVNLAAADVFVSIFPEARAKELLEELKKRTYEFQQIINKRLRMRPVPRISFVRDQSEREAAEVEAELYKMQHMGG